MLDGESRRHWSEDGALADEIELYGELVVAASESDQELTLPQIDKVLGVDQGAGLEAGQEAGQEADTPGDDEPSEHDEVQIDVRDDVVSGTEQRLSAGPH